MKKVVGELSEQDGNWVDEIDHMVQDEIAERENKKCINPECATTMKKQKRKCEVCGALQPPKVSIKGKVDENPMPKKVFEKRTTVSTSKSKGKIKISTKPVFQKKSIYEGHKCENVDTNPSISNLHPVNANPCSYTAVVDVLLSIGRQTGVAKYGNGKRQWLPVVCDGVPFVLCKRIISCTHRCCICNQGAIVGQEALTKHFAEKHIDVDDDTIETSFELEFDWVMLVPGTGHIEMNILRSCVELTFEVFYKEILKSLNFTTDKALHYAKKVNDFHKG